MTASAFIPHARRIALLVFTALPIAAAAQVEINQQPLVVAQPIPPNILYILDDSGSMLRNYMPDDAPRSGIGFTTAQRNALAYNPLVEYEPWYNADGTKMADQDYDEWVSKHPTLLTTTTRIKLADNAQCFHTPQNATSDPNKDSQLYRWRLTDDGASRCNANSNCNSTSDCTSIPEFNWTDLGGKTRTIAEEKTNYANWYHYYRTRMKMAKAASTRAFAGLGESYRLGFTTINTTGNNIEDIPVTNEDGLFKNKNRTSWFDELNNVGILNASQVTPLRAALDRAGQYFSSDAPYGPDNLSCRQNFAILTTDGYWNSTAATSSQQVSADNDSNDGETITGPNGASYRYIAERPYKDGRSNTLADVAMHYWKNDLRDDLKNDVPTSSKNPAFWQHMVTFGISIGEKGVLDPTAATLTDLTNGNETWPAPGNNRKENIDDLWHAAINSRGTFVAAANASEFADSLSSALGAIANRLGSSASLAANSTKLDTNTFTYQAQYWSGTWRGELNAYRVNPEDGSLAADPTWSASAELPDADERNILIAAGNDDSGLASFTWDNLNSEQRTALRSEDVVNYLRGDQSKEAANNSGDDNAFRDRESLLGDIVNSQPVYVGAPNTRLYAHSSFSGGGDAWSAYTSEQANVTPIIYVGANDGMLHGFNAETGEEVFAFIPSAAIRNDLARLASPEYGGAEEEEKHRYFVDGELTVADVFQGSGSGNGNGKGNGKGNKADGEWRTVLVGTMGRGGRSVFALDVTTPEEPTLIWEKSAEDISALDNLGNNLGKPIIAQVAEGDWQVLLGNGPNGEDGDARLIMIDADGDTTMHVAGAGNNGLSAVYTWDSDGDEFIDTAYAGDLKGNLWRFSNLSAGTPSVEKLFEARDENGAAQPITAAPLVGINPADNSRWVFFGTGQYLNTADLSNVQVQTWYGLRDEGEPISRTDLMEREILREGEVNGFSARVIEEGNPSELAGKSGWYIDLKSSDQNDARGERMVVPNQFQGDALVGTTRIPDGSDPCSPSGTGFTMAIDPFTGARLSRTFFDLTMDGLFNNADLLNGEIVSGLGFHAGPNNPIFIEDTMLTSLDDGTTRAIGTQGSGTGVTRQSWREVLR